MPLISEENKEVSTSSAVASSGCYDNFQTLYTVASFHQSYTVPSTSVYPYEENLDKFKNVSKLEVHTSEEKEFNLEQYEKKYLY